MVDFKKEKVYKYFILSKTDDSDDDVLCLVYVMNNKEHRYYIYLPKGGLFDDLFGLDNSFNEFKKNCKELKENGK